MRESVVLLHGFGGTRRAWDGVASRLDRRRFQTLALDLPGHGEAVGHPLPITFAACVAYVLERAPARFTLCGYSLGGRIGLQLALAQPARVDRLVLVSCSPGIEDPAERAARRAADARLAEELEHGPYDQFIERWRSQPLFASEPPAAGELARADQRRNDPRALAAVLRGVGAGEMQPLWGQLSRLAMPVSILSGGRDERYTRIGRRMAALIPDAELTVARGGHALVLENPAAVASALATARRAPRSRTASGRTAGSGCAGS